MLALQHSIDVSGLPLQLQLHQKLNTVKISKSFFTKLVSEEREILLEFKQIHLSNQKQIQLPQTFWAPWGEDGITPSNAFDKLSGGWFGGF